MPKQVYSISPTGAVALQRTIEDRSESEAVHHHQARPMPRISIQAFCENPAMAEVVQIASEDRRLAKTHVSVHMGGIEAAVTHYQQNPTPNLIIVESSLPREQILPEL